MTGTDNIGTPLQRLDPSAIARVVETLRDLLKTHREELNRLNVYPVPDGDTGTNMSLTLESVAKELARADRSSMEDVCEAIAHGSLMGARGNSGVILSQILRGLCDEFAKHEDVGVVELRTALRTGADAAYEAVLRPVEGTILTVARETAEWVEKDDATNLGVLLANAATAADESVLRTPDLLPALKDAGVVDAGGRGFTLLLAALRHVAVGEPLPEPRHVERAAGMEGGAETDEFRYEVMFLLDADDATIPAFKQAWAAVGDSIVIVGGKGLWNCHIHTNAIGAAIEAGIDAGRPRQVRVTDLIEEVEEEQWVHEERVLGLGGTAGAAGARAPQATAVVAIGVGAGVQRLFASFGVSEIIAGGQSMNPSTQEILDAVERAPSDSVIVLPNNKNIIPVANQVDSLTAKSVHVLPTTAVPEGLASLIRYDPDDSLEENFSAMTSAVDSVRCGEVTRAVRDASADGLDVKTGDWIAIGDGKLLAVAANAVGAVNALVDILVGDNSEIVTLIIGADARHTDVERIEQHLALNHASIEVERHDGGQPIYPYLLAVE
ncbi:MAG: DAK2 domain-containing protein [Acidimicrobiia bacterium]